MFKQEQDRGNVMIKNQTKRGKRTPWPSVSYLHEKGFLNSGRAEADQHSDWEIKSRRQTKVR